MAAPAAEVTAGAEYPLPPGHRRPPLGVLRRTLREVGLALITIGVIILLFVAYQLWGTGIAEAHSQASLKRQFNAAVAGGAGDNPTVATGATTATGATGVKAGVKAAGPSPAPGGAVDHLVIPKIHLDVFVVQGVAESDLERGPGHYPQTVMPGQDGNAAIAGHRTTYGAPFFDVSDLSVGDSISLTDTTGRTFVYKVSERPQVVSPNDVAVLNPTSFPQLTLTTCNPRFSATSRLVIVARLTNQSPLPVTKAPAAPTTPAITSAPVAPPAGTTDAAVDTLGSGNRKAWPPALAYGAAVLVLWAAVRLLVNRTRRWARAGAFVAGTAVCLVPLWFCFENVVRLLPQNI